jgi:selenocysteine-specific elongation factor
MYVIGTAGHVDHGKSTLVKALTGIDPDRWAEEQRREMTIDLGFAWLTLPSGRRVSVVDVPGHERFIKNMLAGVGGLDAALLIVAADESIMPQTEEHLAILDLLGVNNGLVVLTKADLVDSDWLELVRDEVRERLAGTALATAELIPVSARTGAGLPELQSALDRLLSATPARGNAQGAPRLPVDRSFTIGGFGTVVTGTLGDGPLVVGQEVEVLPKGLRGRIRGLQSHQTREEQALPGTRVAVNLAGVHHSEVARGDVLTLPGSHVPTRQLDVRVRMVRNALVPLVQNMALDLFLAAAEVRCRATLLDAEQLAAGAEGWVQLRLERPIVAAGGDRCILRIPSPSVTIGGGTVIDPHPPRHRRFRSEVTAALETLARGAPDELLLQALHDGPPLVWPALLKATGLPEHAALGALEALVREGRVLRLGDWEIERLGPHGANLPISQSPNLLITREGWNKLAPRIAPLLAAYHRRYPLRNGMPREELRQRLKLDGRALAAVLEEAARQGLLLANETSVWLPEHNPQPGPAERKQLDNLLMAMSYTPYNPPAPELDAELLAWASERRLLVVVSVDVAFLPQTYAELLAWVRTIITNEGSVTVGQLRDRFATSRKYALAFLEHLDAAKITRREGDGRVFW